MEDKSSSSSSISSEDLLDTLSFLDVILSVWLVLFLLLRDFSVFLDSESNTEFSVSNGFSSSKWWTSKLSTPSSVFTSICSTSASSRSDISCLELSPEPVKRPPIECNSFNLIWFMPTVESCCAGISDNWTCSIAYTSLLWLAPLPRYDLSAMMISSWSSPNTLPNKSSSRES